MRATELVATGLLGQGDGRRTCPTRCPASPGSVLVTADEERLVDLLERDRRRDLVIGEADEALVLEVRQQALQRGVVAEHAGQGRDGGLVGDVLVDDVGTHQELDQAKRLLRMLGVLGHREGDVDAGDELGLVGRVHRQGERADLELGVVVADRRDRPDALQVHRHLAGGERPVAVLVALGELVVLAVGEQLLQALGDDGVVLLEARLAVIDLFPEVVGRQVRGQRVPRRQRRPGVLQRDVERRDALRLEGVADGDHLVPGGRRLDAVLGEEVLVVDHAVGVVGERHAVDLTLAAGAEVGEDLHDRRVDGVEHRFLGEVVEDVGAGELGEVPAAVERHHVGDVVAYEPGADRGVGVRDVVQHDVDVGVLGLEVGDQLAEDVDGLALELEELDLRAAVVVVAAARRRSPRRWRRGG